MVYTYTKSIPHGIWFFMIKIGNKNCKKGSLILNEIKFDHIFKRHVMRSGKVGKIYLPKELIDQDVYVVVNINGEKREG